MFRVKNIRGGHGISALSFFDEGQGRFHFGFWILDFGLKKLKKKRATVRWIAAVTMFVALLGCARDRGVVPNSSTREVLDDLGRTVRVPEKIERAISLAPSLTESIFAVGAGGRLVGVTTYCDHPPETASIEKIGDTQTPNIEKIVALRPQVVFVSTASQLEASPCM